MKSRRSSVRIPVVLSALAIAAACVTTGNPGAPRAEKAHPDVGAAAGSEACGACHEGATPAVVKAWSASAHGVGLVRCYVCHGSTGEDFTVAPEAARCAGCHPQQTERVAARPEQAACFSCHAPHSLSAGGKPDPHRS